MSEEIWTNVKVKVPVAWVPNENGPPGTLGELNDYLVEGSGESDLDRESGALTLHFAGVSNYGICGVQEWLDQLEALRIPFEASDEPKYEFEGETMYFDGERYYGSRSGGEGEQLLDVNLWRTIIEGKHDWASDVETYFTKMPDLSTASIEHLLGQPCPWSDE